MTLESSVYLTLTVDPRNPEVMLATGGTSGLPDSKMLQTSVPREMLAGATVDGQLVLTMRPLAPTFALADSAKRLE